MINALDAPVEAAWAELQAAQDAAAAVPARIRLGEIAPDMVRLEAEVKQITHAIRMAAYNAETALARALDGHYARAGDEAYALIREALTGSGDIIPGHGELLIRLDPLTAPAPDPGPRSALRPAHPGPRPLPRHRAHPALRSQIPPGLHDLYPYVIPEGAGPCQAAGMQPFVPVFRRLRACRAGPRASLGPGVPCFPIAAHLW